MIPKVRPRTRQKEAEIIRCPQHLVFVRKRFCSVPNCQQLPIEAAHVRTGTDGGVGMKPGDCFTLPLCSAHHKRQHQIGERLFEKETGIDMRKIADALWGLSPSAKKYIRKVWELKRGDSE